MLYNILHILSDAILYGVSKIFRTFALAKAEINEMGIYSTQFREMARSCGMDYANGRLIITGGSPCGTFADDWRNIAGDMRRVIKKYNDKEK